MHHWPVLQSLLETYQLYAGVRDPILEDTRSFPWCPDGWVSSLRRFLAQTNSQIILQSRWLAPTRRQGDSHIMDDVWMLNLSKTELTDANNVRLYLRVTTLSEITEHTGRRILTSCYHRSDTPEPGTHGSTLQWPTQPSPGKRAWHTWQKILTNLYLTNKSLDLRRPIGPWKQKHINTDWKWQWRICPATLRLYRRHGSQWSSYAMIRQTRTQIQYMAPDHHGSVPPTTAVPVMVVQPQPNSILIQKPLPRIQAQPSPEIPQKPYLLHKLVTPTDPWEKSLWHTIQPHQEIDQLAMDLTCGIPILLSTDAAMNAAK